MGEDNLRTRLGKGILGTAFVDVKVGGVLCECFE